MDRLAIIGLGNPGLKYATTRHNVGFDVIERLAHDHQIKINKKKFKGLMGEGIIAGHKVTLIQPLTYMNRSGECVRELADFYQLEGEKVWLVYDDIDLDLGALRIRQNGSGGSHNGMKNIIQHLGHRDFPRFRVGVGPQPPGMDSAHYVLQTWPKKDMEKLVEVVSFTADAVTCAIQQGVQQAMNDFNRK